MLFNNWTYIYIAYREKNNAVTMVTGRLSHHFILIYFYVGLEWTKTLLISSLTYHLHKYFTVHNIHSLDYYVHFENSLNHHIFSMSHKYILIVDHIGFVLCIVVISVTSWNHSTYHWFTQNKNMNNQSLMVNIKISKLPNIKMHQTILW